MSKYVLLALLLFFSADIAAAADYRNFYGISWRGSACDNINYAKSMGYDFVNYQNGMEYCSNANNIGFFITNPENLGYPDNIWKIDLDRTYTATQKQKYNDFFLWKSSASFPKNLATGWFYDSNSFKPVPDFQRRDVIDKTVAAVLSKVRSVEDKEKNFYFAGYSTDVPSLDGDLWTMLQSSGGKQVKISYWTGSESGVKHPDKTYMTSSYKEGQANFRKILYAKTKEYYPNMKTIVEPYLPYDDYIIQIASRSDKSQLMPDLLCQEAANSRYFWESLLFVDDSRLFKDGLMSKSKMCSSTPKAYTHDMNLKIAGKAAVNSAWFTWFGRFGGTGGMPDYSSIKNVPARLQLIRAMVGWDNLNKADSRKWDGTNLKYSSSDSYADKYVIYSRHPKNKDIYGVVLNKASGPIRIGSDEEVTAIYSTDSLFRKNTRADSHFAVSYSSGAAKLTLKDDANLGKGYIVEVRAKSPASTSQPAPTAPSPVPGT